MGRIAIKTALTAKMTTITSMTTNPKIQTVKGRKTVRIWMNATWRTKMGMMVEQRGQPKF